MKKLIRCEDPECGHENHLLHLRCLHCSEQGTSDNYLIAFFNQDQEAVEMYCATCGRPVVGLVSEGEISPHPPTFPEGVSPHQLLGYRTKNHPRILQIPLDYHRLALKLIAEKERNA